MKVTSSCVLGIRWNFGRESEPIGKMLRKLYSLLVVFLNGFIPIWKEEFIKNITWNLAGYDSTAGFGGGVQNNFESTDSEYSNK